MGLDHLHSMGLTHRTITPDNTTLSQHQPVKLHTKSLHLTARAKHPEHASPTPDEFASALEAVRTTLQPDQTYGLGERMGPLTGPQTLANLKMTTGAFTGAGAQPTQQPMAGRTSPAQ